LEIHYIVLAIHLIVGLTLVVLSLKAFKKTRYPPMALLALGFSLIVLGDTIIGDVLEFVVESDTADLISELIEIPGFLILILAVKRS